MHIPLNYPPRRANVRHVMTPRFHARLARVRWCYFALVSLRRTKTANKQCGLGDCVACDEHGGVVGLSSRCWMPAMLLRRAILVPALSRIEE